MRIAILGTGKARLRALGSPTFNVRAVTASGVVPGPAAGTSDDAIVASASSADQ